MTSGHFPSGGEVTDIHLSAEDVDATMRHILGHGDRRGARPDHSPAMGMGHRPWGQGRREPQLVHRGPLLIHAGMAFEPDGYEAVKRLADNAPPPPAELTHGAIIGVVDLVDCLRDFRSVWAEADQWHWLLRDPRPLDPAVPCAGKLGLWRPPPTIAW